MKIYTRTGDKGETSLLSGERVMKDHERIAAYGTIDELNSHLGLARSLKVPARVDEAMARVQHDLFVLGAALATAPSRSAPTVPALADSAVATLEREVDAWEGELPVLRNFILPGGTPAAAALHVARTVCRRAERLVVSLERGEGEGEGSVHVRYLNRLSDWLFMAARAANHHAGTADVLWKTR